MTELKQSEVDCPNCGTSISITKALSSDIEQKLEKQYQKKFQKLDAALKDQAADLEKKEAELETRREGISKEVEKKLSKDRQALELKIKRDIEAQAHLEVKDLRDQVATLDQRLIDSQKNELDLRKRSRDLDEKQKSLELEVQRKIDEERLAIENGATERARTEFHAKAAEKDKQLEDMKRQIEDLKRKSEQGSQQLQGEVFEVAVEQLLKASFAFDEIDPVAKGVRGADILQKVRSSAGALAGSILWEIKQTKSWSDSWLEKLKDDQRAITAEHAVIVTHALPKGVQGLTNIDGIWVTDVKSVVGLAHALRGSLLQVLLTKAITNGKREKTEDIYNYLTGTQFKHRVESIVEAFRNMRDDLDREKRAFSKIWSSRELQLTRVIEGTAGMYGDVYGILGSVLPPVPHLELESQITVTETAD